MRYTLEGGYWGVAVVPLEYVTLLVRSTDRVVCSKKLWSDFDMVLHFLTPLNKYLTYSRVFCRLTLQRVTGINSRG